MHTCSSKLLFLTSMKNIPVILCPCSFDSVTTIWLACLCKPLTTHNRVSKEVFHPQYIYFSVSEAVECILGFAGYMQSEKATTRDIELALEFVLRLNSTRGCMLV